VSTASSSPIGAHGVPSPAVTAPPATCRLDDARARDPQLAGAKAAALASALAAGFPVLPGFVITTSGTARRSERPGAAGGLADEVRPAWQDLLARAPGPLVVRSSSTAEDLESSSMAGRFESVIGVEGWEAFDEAVAVVLRSARTGAPSDIASAAPMAVLVQPLLDAALGGSPLRRRPGDRSVGPDGRLQWCRVGPSTSSPARSTATATSSTSTAASGDTCRGRAARR
jgi:hypothetical protein